jgi:hypothetical protein
MFMLTFSM